MIISHIEPLSLNEYPETPSCILYSSGCNFKCGYCFNKELCNDELGSIPAYKVDQFLEERKGLIEGVVLTGGEVTQHLYFESVCKHIKELGYKLKINTNGSKPEMLKYLIDNNLVDFVSMDFKCLPINYKQFTDIDPNEIIKSLNILKSSKIPHRIHTTVWDGFFDENPFNELAHLLKGVDTWNIQNLIGKFHKYKPMKITDTLIARIKAQTDFYKINLIVRR